MKSQALQRIVKEIRDAREQVTIFLNDFVEALEIDTKPKRTILLLDE